MTAATAKTGTATRSDEWKRLNAQIRAGCQQLGLDEESRRDLIERTVGKRSLGDCIEAEMRKVRGAIGRANPSPGYKPGKRPGKRLGPARAGGRALADGEVQAKLRALWISGYHLGVVRDPRESALVAFVKRVTGGRDRGIAALEWLSIDGGIKAVEAVKALLARQAGVSWESYRIGVESVELPRARVLEALWRRLYERGAVQIRDHGALSTWCCRHVSWPCHAGHAQLDAEAQDRCIEALGRWLRRVMVARGEIQEGTDR